MAQPAGTTEMNRGRLAFLVFVGLTLATYISFVMVAWLVWSGILYGCYALLSRRLADAPNVLVFLLLAPGAAVNLFFGQNGILSTVLLGGGVLLLGSRPILAGVLLGLLAYKPQLAV